MVRFNFVGFGEMKLTETAGNHAHNEIKYLRESTV